MPAVNGLNLCAGSHHCALSLFAGDVANHVEVVGTCDFVALIELGHQCQSTRGGVELINGDGGSLLAGVGSYPKVAETVDTNLVSAKEFAKGLAIESNGNRLLESACLNVVNVNESLHHSVVLAFVVNIYGLLGLRLRHIHLALGHNGRTGTGCAVEGRVLECCIESVSTVEHPIVGHADTVNRSVFNAVGSGRCAGHCHYSYCC